MAYTEFPPVRARWRAWWYGTGQSPPLVLAFVCHSFSCAVLCVGASVGTLLSLDVAVKVQAREHVGGPPVFFELCHGAGALVLAALGIIFGENRPGFKKYNLRDAPADHQR